MGPSIWSSAPGCEIEVELDLTTRLRECGRSVDADGIGLRIEIPVDGAPSHEPSVAEPLRYADGPVDGYDPSGRSRSGSPPTAR